MSVTKVGDNIVLNMPGNVTFATDQSDVQAGFYPVLNSVAKVLKEYEKTLVHVTGHTDSTGGYQYNMDLSQRRADSVSSYLAAQGVQAVRLWLEGLALPGFTTVILLQLLIGGLLMISLGIIGTYIARIYDEVKGRPRYVIRERLDAGRS